MLENNFGRFSGDRADFSDITVRMPKIARGTGGTGGKSVVEEELRAPVETDLSEGLGEVIASAGGMSTGFSSFVAGKGERSMTNQDVLPERNIPTSEKIDTKPVTDGETNLYTKAQVAEMVRNAVNIATRGAAQPDMNEVIAEEVKKAVALAISQVKSVDTRNVNRTAEDNKVMDKGISERRTSQLTKKAKNYQDEYVEMSGGSIGLVQGDDDTGMIQVDFLTNVGGEWTWANNMEIVPKEEVKRTLNWSEIQELNIKDAKKKASKDEDIKKFIQDFSSNHLMGTRKEMVQALMQEFGLREDQAHDYVDEVMADAEDTEASKHTVARKLRRKAVGDTPKDKRVDSEKDGFGGGDGQEGGETGKVVDPVGAMPGEKVREAKIKDSKIWQGPEGWNVSATFDSEDQARQAFTTMFSGYAGSELEGSKKVADENGPSDADVQAKAYEMFKESWDALSSEQMDQVYKALGVKEGHKKVAQIQSLDELKDRDFEITDPEMVDMDLDDLQQAVDNADDYDLKDFEVANIEKRIRMGSTQRALEDAQKVGEEDPIEEVIRKKEGRMEVANVDYTKGVTAMESPFKPGDSVKWKEEVADPEVGPTGDIENEEGWILSVEGDQASVEKMDGTVTKIDLKLLTKTAAGVIWTGEGKPTKSPKKPGGVIDNTVKEETAINEHQARRQALRMARKQFEKEVIQVEKTARIWKGHEVSDTDDAYELAGELMELDHAKETEENADLYYQEAEKLIRSTKVADSKEVGRQIRDKAKEHQAPKDGADTVVRPVEKFVGKDTSSKVERAVTDRATGDTVFGTDKPDEMKEKKKQRRQKRKTGTLLKLAEAPGGLYAGVEFEIHGERGGSWKAVALEDPVQESDGSWSVKYLDKDTEVAFAYWDSNEGNLWMEDSAREASKKVADISDITEEDFQAYEDVRSSGVTNMWAVDVVEEISGLPKEKIMRIMKEYGELMKKYPNVRQAKKASLAVGDMVSVFSEEEEDYNGQKGEVTEVKPGGTPESVRYMVKMPNGDEVDFGADNVVKVGVDETPDEEIESGAPKVSMRKKEKIAVLKSELAKLLELANFYDENGLVEEASKLDVVREQRMAQLKKAEEEPETDEDVIEKKEAYFTNCHKGDEGWFE